MIKMKRWFIIILFLSVGVGAMQTMAQQALKVGDSCPDLEFEYFFKAHVTKKSFSDYSDKWILLDFWATYCSGCVAGLKKLETLGELYQDRLAVIPVATQNDEQVIKFWTNNAFTRPLGIGTMLLNEMLENLFPRQAVPHYVLINPEREIVAITYAEFINENNIGKALSNIPIRFADKTIENPVVSNVENSEEIDGLVSREHSVGYSSLKGYDPRMQSSSGYLKLDTVGDKVYCVINNNTLYEMYLKTVNADYAKFSKLRIIENIDSSELFFNKTAGGYRIDWDSKNKYIYSISFLRGQSREKVLAKVRSDLDFYFDLNGRIERRELKVWKVKIDADRIKANDVYNKKVLTLGSIINILQKSESVPYILFNDGRLKDVVICAIEDFPGITSAEEIKTWLTKAGVEITENMEEVNCFVLSRN